MKIRIRRVWKQKSAIERYISYMKRLRRFESHDITKEAAYAYFENYFGKVAEAIFNRVWVNRERL